MKGKIVHTIEYGALQPPRFLLFDTEGDAKKFVSCEGERVASPLMCLSRAVDEKPEVIVVRMGKGTLLMREASVELCMALKRNVHTNSIPILVLLHSKQRKLLEKLKQAGVEFIKYCDETPLDFEKTRRIIEFFQPEDMLKFHLEKLCPFLNYRRIDARHEMTVCGAYLDRMVLGGKRLREICHTRDHHHCIYFLHPKDVP